MMRNVAEEVILASLNRQMQEEGTNTAAEKFTVLWHIGRDLEPTKCETYSNLTHTWLITH